VCNVFVTLGCAVCACVRLSLCSYATHWRLSAALRPRASPAQLRSLLKKGPRSSSQRDIVAAASILKVYFCVAHLFAIKRQSMQQTLMGRVVLSLWFLRPIWG
jgi:hypothetical protein